MGKLYRIRSVKPIAFGICDQVLVWKRKNRDVPAVNYYDAIEGFDPDLDYACMLFVDSLFTEEEANRVLGCLAGISEDVIGKSSIYAEDLPISFVTEEDEDEDEEILGWPYEIASGYLDLEPHILDLFPFQIACDISVHRDYTALKKFTRSGLCE